MLVMGAVPVLVAVACEVDVAGPELDDVGTLGALLLGPDGGFITGSDFLMDGGVTASYFYGELAPE